MTRTIPKASTPRSEASEVQIADPSLAAVRTDEHECAAARLSNGQPAGTKEVIRSRAHSKWEAAGCPPGDGFDFWLEAEREIHAGPSEASPPQ